MRGAFIVFEGGDRSGKSTQAKLLHKHLLGQGINCELWRYPNRETAIGKMISSYLSNQTDLDDHVVHLLFSANRWETANLLKEKINSGVTLIVDRYIYSGVAFSAAKGLDRIWCASPDYGLPKPDLVIYLNLSIKKAEARGEFGMERYEKSEFQRKVTQEYEKLKSSTWHIIEADDTIENLHIKVKQLVDISRYQSIPMDTERFEHVFTR